jgi:hypothetical protein
MVDQYTTFNYKPNAVWDADLIQLAFNRLEYNLRIPKPQFVHLNANPPYLADKWEVVYETPKQKPVIVIFREGV